MMSEKITSAIYIYYLGIFISKTKDLLLGDKPKNHIKLVYDTKIFENVTIHLSSIYFYSVNFINNKL